MKKVFLAFQIIVLIMALISCSPTSNNSDLSASSNDINQSETQNIDWSEETASPIAIGNRLCDTMGFPDQSVPPKYEWINLSGTNDIETEYDNFDITLDYESYKFNSIIRIHISNKNDKPYSFYPIPYIEKYNSSSNTWERLIYAPDEAYYGAGWHTGIDDVTVYFNPYYLAQPIESGEYRFIVFAGEKEFYSKSFTIIK